MKESVEFELKVVQRLIEKQEKLIKEIEKGSDNQALASEQIYLFGYRQSEKILNRILEGEKCQAKK